jgi:hypothetical protein
MANRHGPVALVVSSAPLRDVMGDIVRLDLSHRPFARAGRVIGIRVGGVKVLAVVRGPANVGKSGISLDSAMRTKLGVELNKCASFTFERATLWDEVVWAWSATDATPRVAARLGAISVMLGGIGLLLGLISLFK